MVNDNCYQLGEKCTVIYYLRQERGIMMTLANGKVGMTYTVNSLELDNATMRRLGALGLNRGTKVKLLNRNRGGSVIIMVRGSRLALGKHIAELIQMGEAA